MELPASELQEELGDLFDGDEDEEVSEEDGDISRVQANLFGPSVGQVWRKKKRKQRYGKTKASHLPPELSALFGSANAAYISGNVSDAVPLYRQLIEKAPRFPDPYHALGSIYEEKGDMASAAEVYRSLMAVAPVDVDTILKVADWAYQQNDFALSSDMVARAGRVDNNVNVKSRRVLLILCRRDAPSYGRATTELNRLLAEYPNHFNILYDAALLCKERGFEKKGYEYLVRYVCCFIPETSRRFSDDFVDHYSASYSTAMDINTFVTNFERICNTLMLLIAHVMKDVFHTGNCHTNTNMRDVALVIEHLRPIFMEYQTPLPIAAALYCGYMLLKEDASAAARVFMPILAALKIREEAVRNSYDPTSPLTMPDHLTNDLLAPDEDWITNTHHRSDVLVLLYHLRFALALRMRELGMVTQASTLLTHLMNSSCREILPVPSSVLINRLYSNIVDEDNMLYLANAITLNPNDVAALDLYLKHCENMTCEDASVAIEEALTMLSMHVCLLVTKYEQYAKSPEPLDDYAPPAEGDFIGAHDNHYLTYDTSTTWFRTHDLIAELHAIVHWATSCKTYHNDEVTFICAILPLLTAEYVQRKEKKMLLNIRGIVLMRTITRFDQEKYAWMNEMQQHIYSCVRNMARFVHLRKLFDRSMFMSLQREVYALLEKHDITLDDMRVFEEDEFDAAAALSRRRKQKKINRDVVDEQVNETVMYDAVDIDLISDLMGHLATSGQHIHADAVKLLKSIEEIRTANRLLQSLSRMPRGNNGMLPLAHFQRKHPTVLALAYLTAYHTREETRLDRYLSAMILDGTQPALALCVAQHISSLIGIRNTQVSYVKALVAINLYSCLRAHPKHAIEVRYNLARFFTEAGLNNISEKLYLSIIERSELLSQEPDSYVTLSAHNLVLLYKQAENNVAAMNLMKKYLVV